MHPEVISRAGRVLAEALPEELFKRKFHLAGGTGAQSGKDLVVAQPGAGPLRHNLLFGGKWPIG